MFFGGWFARALLTVAWIRRETLFIQYSLLLVTSSLIFPTHVAFPLLQECLSVFSSIWRLLSPDPNLGYKHVKRKPELSSLRTSLFACFCSVVSWFADHPTLINGTRFAESTHNQSNSHATGVFQSLLQSLLQLQLSDLSALHPESMTALG